MKLLIFIGVFAALVCAGCGNSSASATRVKSSAAAAQFKPSDHMPPEALAAKKAAGD